MCGSNKRRSPSQDSSSSESSVEEPSLHNQKDVPPKKEKPKNAKSKRGKAKAAAKPARFIPTRIERLTILADSTHIGFSREKYMNPQDMSLNDSEMDLSAGNQTGEESNSNIVIPLVHQILLDNGFKPAPNEQKFHNSLIYAVHKKHSGANSSRNSTRDPKSEGGKNVTTKTGTHTGSGTKGTKVQWSKDNTTSAKAKIDEPKRSQKSILMDRYRFCDIVVDEYKYRKRIGDMAAEVFVVSPHISESDRVYIVRNPCKYYMKHPPYSIKDETDLYVIRPPSNFRTKNVELNMLIHSFDNIRVDKIKIDQAEQLIENAFDADGNLDKSKNTQSINLSLSVNNMSGDTETASQPKSKQSGHGKKKATTNN